MRCAANGEKFHFAFLRFFRLYVRLFLNSFGIQASMTSVRPLSPLSPLALTLTRARAQTSQTSPSLQALSACYTSALEGLQIVAKDFAGMAMLVSCPGRIFDVGADGPEAVQPGVDHDDDGLFCGVLAKSKMICKLITNSWN